jgi:hypothetical protein
MGGTGRIFWGEGDPAAEQDVSGDWIRSVVFDNSAPSGTTDECIILREAQGLEIADIFHNLGKAISTTTAHGSTGYHTLAQLGAIGNRFAGVDYDVFTDHAAWMSAPTEPSPRRSSATRPTPLVVGRRMNGASSTIDGNHFAGPDQRPVVNCIEFRGVR